MKGRFLAVIVPVWLAGHPLPAVAASHAELTPMPIGSIALTRGEQDIKVRIPLGANGILPQALVAIAAQPTTQPADSATLDSNAPQVEATITFKSADQVLPAWKLDSKPTAYVIDPATMQSNPAFAEYALQLHVKVETSAEGVTIVLVGMPDPIAFAPAAGCGELGQIAGKVGGEAGEYLKALAREISGDASGANASYERLAKSSDDSVGRFARRGLRLMAYQLRKRKLSGSFDFHLRWGLYLEECGLFALAQNEYEECRIIYPPDYRGQFRGGLQHYRLGAQPFDSSLYLLRAIETCARTTPRTWRVLLLLADSRETGGAISAGEGSSVSMPATGADAIKLSPADRTAFLDNWMLAQFAVRAATAGHVQVMSSIVDVSDPSQIEMTWNENGAPKISNELIERHGWFDAVVWAHPRRPAEAGRLGTTYGGAGPKGTSVSVIYTDASWNFALNTLCAQFGWTIQAGQIGPGYPPPDEAAGVGHRPNPTIGVGWMEALNALMTPAMARRMSAAARPAPGSSMHFWTIEGPYPVTGDAGPSASHVLDKLPDAPSGAGKTIDSESDFIDVGSLFAQSKSALALAKTWVYAPGDGEVRMWLGGDGPLAVWVNDRLCYADRQVHARPNGRVDAIAGYAFVRQGWNAVRLVTESTADGWGFSIRFSDRDDKPIPGLAYCDKPPENGIVPAYLKPEAGKRFSWQTCADDYSNLLPRLTAADLEKLTGLPGISLAGAANGAGGYFSIATTQAAGGGRYRDPPQKWDASHDRDMALNNILDWDREHCAALRYHKDSAPGELLFIRPEAVKAYLTLLQESDDAARLGPPARRLLGYVVVPNTPSQRTLIVVDARFLNTDGWPMDEEDLLSPPADD